MVIGEVVGKVWADRIIPSLQGRRMVLVRTAGAELVAVDPLNAGIGTTVLVATDEAAAAVTGVPTSDAAVVALVADPAGRPAGADPPPQ